MDLYVDFILNTKVDPVFAAFKTGFYNVCGRSENNCLVLFSPQELMTLVVGHTDYKWEELQKVSFFNNDLYQHYWDH